MGKITKIIAKNIKVLLRAKVSSLIVIYGPLLVMFLVGIAYDNSTTTGVKIGVYSDSYSDIAESIIAKLSETHFDIIKQVSEDYCIDQLKKGEVNLCLVFPPDLGSSSGASNEILFYVDYSKLNLVWMVLDAVSTKVESKRKELSIDLTTVLLNKLRETQQKLKSNSELIQKITEDNKKISAEAQELYTTAEGIDVSFNASSLGIGEISARLGQLPSQQTAFKAQADSQINDLNAKLTYVKTLNNQLRSIITETKSIVSDAQDDINAVEGNTTDSDLEAIKDNLNEAEHNLNQALIKINHDYTNLTNVSSSSQLNTYLTKLNSQVEEIQSLINSLSSNLEQLELKLQTASQIKSRTLAKVKDIQNMLDSNNKQLVQLANSINDIDNSINSLTVSNATKVINPITTKIKPVTSTTYLNYMFPGFIVLIIMFVTILLSSTIVSIEKTSRAHFRNFISPTSDFVFIAGNYITNLILIFVQLFVVLAIAAIFFKTLIISTLLMTLLILLLISTFFILLGMLIGYIFNSDETTTLASVIIASLLLVLSGLILPLESMSGFIVKIAHYNPFVISEYLLKQAILFHSSLKDLLRPVIVLAVMCVVLLVLILLLTKISRFKLVHRSRHKKHKKHKSNKNKNKHSPTAENETDSKPFSGGILNKQVNSDSLSSQQKSGEDITKLAEQELLKQESEKFMLK